MPTVPLPLKFLVIGILALLLVLPTSLPLTARIPLLGALLVGGILWVSRAEQAYVDDETTPLPWETEAQARERIAAQRGIAPDEVVLGEASQSRSSKPEQDSEQRRE